MQWVSQVEVGAEGPGTQCGRYILKWADDNWYWSKATLLAPLLENPELDTLITRMVKSTKYSRAPLRPILQSDQFLSNRSAKKTIEKCIFHKNTPRVSIIHYKCY